MKKQIISFVLCSGLLVMPISYAGNDSIPQLHKVERKQDSAIRRISFIFLHLASLGLGSTMTKYGTLGCLTSISEVKNDNDIAPAATLLGLSSATTIGGISLVMYGLQGLYKDCLNVIADIKHAQTKHIH
jgi:hypothetical protein